MLLLTVAVLAWPALQGATLSWSYDAHSSLPARYSASRGMDIVQRHWSVGEISQARVLVASGDYHSLALRADNTGSAYCFGDGTGASCPCGAHGNPGEGAIFTIILPVNQLEGIH